MLVFDNVSDPPAWISETFCQLATGGGFAVRQFYTDQDDALFDAARPVILNGVEDIVTQPTLPTARCSSRWSQSPKSAVMTEWTGTVSDLLGALGEAAGERIAKSKTWSDSRRALSGRLRRAATFLRKIGIKVSFEREGRARTRIIRITAAGADPVPERGVVQPSTPSAPIH